MSATLLPPNTTPLERRIADTTGIISELPSPLRQLWNPATIPADLLPYLAWALSIEEEWRFARSDQERRTLVATSIDLHRYKGTPYAVRRGMQLLGFRDAEIIEGLPALHHDGEIARDGHHAFAGAARWALFRVAVDLGNQEGLDRQRIARIRHIIEYYKNARSHLYALTFRANLSSAVDRPAQLFLPLAVGLQLRRAKGVRDGRLPRGSVRRYRRDGELRFNSETRRSERVVVATTRYQAGRLYWRQPLSLHLRTSLTWEALLPRDGRLAFDDSARRGLPMATVTPPTLRTTRTLPRNGRFTRQGFGPERRGAVTYGSGQLRGGHHRYHPMTQHEAFA